MDWTVKYDGRGFLFEVRVNTDEDPTVIVKRLREAAGGPKMNATVIAVRNLSPDAVKDMLTTGARLDVATGVAGFPLVHDKGDDALRRIEDCVSKLDEAWRADEECYGENLDPYAVRYAHLFLAALPASVRGTLGVSNLFKSISKFTAGWKPTNPEAPRPEQVGRYDDTVVDGDLRRLHLAMKAMIARKKGKS